MADKYLYNTVVMSETEYERLLECKETLKKIEKEANAHVKYIRELYQQNNIPAVVNAQYNIYITGY